MFSLILTDLETENTDNSLEPSPDEELAETSFKRVAPVERKKPVTPTHKVLHIINEFANIEYCNLCSRYVIATK